nr:MAG TPA: hypothetical protein [Caudoviricetes sp.]DAE61623.1 MAG TPA: hypothetical protein [Caudoviricetes sp.]DAL98766.1 MAG TPA: hypothetical protein [Caudoviricetes sp.]DAP86311.1 MAG TPA: hypothetical protein [Caudoviricetes sp.]
MFKRILPTPNIALIQEIEVQKDFVRAEFYTSIHLPKLVYIIYIGHCMLCRQFLTY